MQFWVSFFFKEMVPDDESQMRVLSVTEENGIIQLILKANGRCFSVRALFKNNSMNFGFYFRLSFR